MVQLTELVAYCDDLLEVDAFSDYCPNGLQVQGRAEIGTLVSGVTASLALIEAALAREADALVVHHGYFWRGEDPCIAGMKRERLRRLLAADVSLLAYHLPLDAHPVYGNNARLAEVLQLSVAGHFGRGSNGPAIAMYGCTATPLPADAFAYQLAHALGREALHIPGGGAYVHSIAWCTGAAQDYIDQAIALGVDAYLTGEVSEQTVHVARECGLHFFAAGHHATERYGVKALGEHLAERFTLEHHFIDIDNPA